MTALARTRLAALLLAGIGFALALRCFYPGIRTFDAGYVYDSIAAGRHGDWQSPVMAVVWAAVDPLAPGPGSMLLLIAGLYWFGFGLLAFALAPRSRGAALALPLVALMPPAFVFVGVIWRDMLFATVWLVAAALTYAGAGRRRGVRLPLQGLALAAVLLGVLLRPNAVIAAPLLAAYALWPEGFSLKRVALLWAPLALGGLLLIQGVYYGVLKAERQHPLHSLLVFDLGGITHIGGQNRFPIAWTPEQAALLTGRCYDPARWDTYWYIEPCRFVMQRLEGEGLFGTPALAAAWRRAVAAEPAAYLRHRATYVWTLLAGANLTLPLDDLSAEQRAAYMADPLFRAVVAIHDALKPTPLFRAGTWALVLLVLCGLAWRRRASPEGAFVLGTGGCALAYLASFAAVGVAADFRYAYWAVLAALAGAAVSAAGRRAAPA